jgi:hypothetical protein
LFSTTNSGRCDNGSAADEADEKMNSKQTRSAGYEDAVKLLGTPATWCQGAELLVKLADRQALVPLMRAYKARAEANKLCLYEAMEILGGEKEARNLIAHDDPDVRLLGIRLMNLFPSDEHLPLLANAARDDRDESVRAEAINSLGLQKQTPGWEALMIPLLESPDEKLRSAAEENLSSRDTDSARQALSEHRILHNRGGDQG